MSFIRYKKIGQNQYAYEVTSYWDSITKRPRQKVRYLGVVDEKGKIVKKELISKEKLILDFGDTYLLYEFMKKANLITLLEKVFGKETKRLLSLIYYRIVHPSSMIYAKLWYEGNIASILFKDLKLSSQRISEFLQLIGDEQLQRDFFKCYISSFTEVEGSVIIDTTALPNQIHFPFSVWGYHDGDIEKQIRFLFVVDKKTAMPLFFRYLPGNIVDVSCLTTTIEELSKLGIAHSFVLMDAAFFSEDNIKDLYDKGIEFLTRLPSGRSLYRELIMEEVQNLERFENAVRYGKRALFIKERQVSLYGKQAYAYIILDPDRKGRETKKLLLQAMEEDIEDIDYRLLKQGTMILISSFKVSINEVIPYYYMRQRVEALFGFSKDDLRLIPLRIHK
ncbi:MAG: IS1634 family transposase, partial [Elusimicrobiales bacterium]